MRKSAKRPKSASRPPVDAFQYEKLAVSAFHFCEQQLNQFDTLLDLATSLAHGPTAPGNEQQHQHALIALLVDTAKRYRQDLEHDRHLYQVIALDAKGIAHRCITARHAANLLAEAAETANDAEAAYEV